ncbi:hypothetical protein GKD24_13025 [Lactobacillus paracasei]|nr:hypothetical protein [Lacticaseibacillus paracasei]MSC31453.1 hypothetical protein [Lacticaseibacillus paracasei]MSC37812.1 hypothetical protein [Lacticaseibacillus paracasei]MSC44188.1 hypothetical protein [Lacticaseibacillus paracasei]
MANPSSSSEQASFWVVTLLLQSRAPYIVASTNSRLTKTHTWIFKNSVVKKQDINLNHNTQLMNWSSHLWHSDIATHP